jgi:DNA repair exonuclease SbcCD nuclease subunit
MGFNKPIFCIIKRKRTLEKSSKRNKKIMKISILADCHLNKSNYKNVLDEEFTNLPVRTADFMRSYKYMIDKNINEIKPDLIVLAGDTYDTFDPSNDVRSFFNEQIKKVREAKIPFIILVGNHDICKKHYPLKPLKELGLKGVQIVESPKMTVFKDHILMMFPYSLEVEQGNITLKEQFKNFIQESKEKIKNNEDLKDKEIIFFGHFGVKGATISDYYEKGVVNKNDSNLKKKSFKNSSEKDITVEDLDTIGAKYVILGDYHKHHFLDTKKCVSLYTGSIERTDMSEIGESKGFVVYDSSKKEEDKIEFIEYPNCRPLIEINGTIGELNGAVDTFKEEDKNAIVKISFNGNKDQLVDFSVGLESLKEKIIEKTQAVHIYHEQNVVNEKEKEQANKIEKELEIKTEINNEDVIEAVEELIEDREKDEKHKLKLKQIANEIYKEAIEG